MVVLVGVSIAALSYVLPISIAIAIVLAIVVVSYTQTVRAYETSGGAYVVAKDNLGTLPSLVAGAALLVDYILTVAVSVTAGVLALTSAAPSLEPHKVGLSLGFVALLTIVNLRGVRESGVLFALPDLRLRRGHVPDGRDGHRQVRRRLVPPGGRTGSTRGGRRRPRRARDPPGVRLGQRRAHRRRGDLERRRRLPDARRASNAALTLLAMGAIAISLFLGVSYLAVSMNAAPSSSVSVISEIARGVFPASSSTSFVYYAVQALTFAHPHPRREHVVPGLPAPRCGARTRPLLPAPVREPRRPPRLLERDRRARRARGAADLGVPCGRHRPDPPLRDRRLHGVHDLADGDGPLLAAARAARLALARGDQRHGSGRDRPRRGHRRS